MRTLRAVALCLPLFIALNCVSSCVPSCLAATRHYYIAAEDVTWNYAPSGHNLLNGGIIRQPWALKLQWPKTRFIEYTDDTFATQKPQPEWLGILGPIIRAEVGDEVIVEFLNRTHLPHDMHPHGLRYDKNNEGSFYIPFGKGDRVAPGQRYTYHWFANAASGPGPGQPSSIVWWYHAHVDPGIEVNAGLMGPIVVTAKGQAKPDGSPKGVDREFVASFMVFDEMAAKPAGLFYAINGFIFGNLPGLVMKQGDKVRWYLLGMGNEIDLHTPHWHGETVTDGRRNTDVIELLPGSMATVDMLADNPGTWMFHCHVQDHMESGMMAVYTIYVPSTRSCPLAITGGDFWKSREKSTLTVKNIGDKAISSFALTSEMFLAPQDLRRPFNSSEWSSSKPFLIPEGASVAATAGAKPSDVHIAPGQEFTREGPAIPPASAQTVMGWVFFPTSVKYEDGSVWKAQSEGECFGVIWRDPQHPDLPALPPRQMEINPD